jgi:hypothetical protein
LTAAADAVLADAGVEHRAHGLAGAVVAAELAVADEEAVAIIGPYRSAEVAAVLEVTAPAGVALLAPMATWAGVTRDDEPGCDDAAVHLGTVFRLLARDTVVAARLARDVVASDRRAFVLAGHHPYGLQLDGQLRLAGLPRAEDADHADLVVLCGLAGEPEVAEAMALAPRPVIAFDGIQGDPLPAHAEVRLVLPLEPLEPGPADPAIIEGVLQAQRAAELVVTALRHGATGRAQVLLAIRRLGPFDEHGDPLEAPVWLWHALPDWRLEPERPLV